MNKQRINLDTDGGVYGIDVPNPITIEKLIGVLETEQLSVAENTNSSGSPNGADGESQSDYFGGY